MIALALLAGGLLIAVNAVFVATEFALVASRTHLLEEAADLPARHPQDRADLVLGLVLLVVQLGRAHGEQLVGGGGVGGGHGHSPLYRVPACLRHEEPSPA